MARKKYDGAVLVAITAGEDTTVDNDYVGAPGFNEAEAAGLTTVFDFPTSRWIGVPVPDEGTSPNFDEAVNVEATTGGEV